MVDTPRARMVFQYDVEIGTATVVVSGTYSGAPAAIEARRGEGEWTLIDGAPSDGHFSGALPDQPVGRSGVEVRFADDPDTTVSIPDVGVGNVVVIAGQSNAVMWLATLHQTANQVSVWRDPIQYRPDDPNLVAWADDPIHSCFPLAGSVWPELGDRVVASTGGVPLMFIAAAATGTGLVDPPDWRPPDGPRPGTR
jgi:hypothetical protein